MVENEVPNVNLRIYWQTMLKLIGMWLGRSMRMVMQGSPWLVVSTHVFLFPIV